MTWKKYKRLAFLFLTAVFFCAAVSQAAFPSKQGEMTEVIVEENQTLWDIAARHSGDDTDIRRYIYSIRQINHISDPGNIQPGQILKLPKI